MFVSAGEYPESKTIGDHFYGALAVGLNAVPYVGGSLAEALEYIFGSPLQRRRDAFFRTLGEAVVEIQKRGITVEQLTQNDDFVSAAMRAGVIAVGQHIEEKLEMLKACLVNQALPHVLSDLIAARFLELVNELEVQHIMVLRYADAPEQWYTDHGLPLARMPGSRQQVFEQAELGLDPNEREFIASELHLRRLTSPTLGNVVTGDDLYRPWITDLGHEFLNWIKIV